MSSTASSHQTKIKPPHEKRLDTRFYYNSADNLPESKVLLADRGYDADRIRKTMDERDIITQIPMRKTRMMRVGVDHRLYRLRNMVEL